MVRLHRFGDKDDEAAPNTPSTKLPSYTAMCELASADNQVSTLLLDERWQKAQEAFGPVEEPEGEDGSWRQLLDKNSQGNPEKSIDWLLDKYGGDALQWTKEKGFGFVEDEYGEIHRVEIHWYQEPSVGRVEMKLKYRDGRAYLDDE